MCCGLYVHCPLNSKGTCAVIDDIQFNGNQSVLIQEPRTSVKLAYSYRILSSQL